MADDDTLLDIKNMDLASEYDLACLKGRPIVDLGRSKRYVGKYWFWIDQIPPRYIIPTHCNGQCYIISRENALKIYQMAKTTDRKNFRIEGINVSQVEPEAFFIQLSSKNN